MGLIFNLLAILAILISSLGLYGLSAFVTEQQTKQIGIRKVLGATIISLITLQTKGFFKLVFIALVIALPLAWIGMNSWLEDFAYHVNISWWILFIAGISVFVITILTMSHQLIKVSLANPVDSLRSE
ncbi:FtsX-like permease family protein [Reichenbachiella sp. MALMAid0571]|uniref:ABC transporter permease n=1 Tax=Reichenbachiella sp. MALMAid0571 TaxID=3143939 RepID=UPI0032DFC83E